MKVFVINKERRSAPKMVGGEERRVSIGTTTRYLLIVNHPVIEKIVKKEFSKEPHSVHPHEFAEDYLFYCVAGRPNLSEEQFIRELIKKIKNRLRKENLLSIEFHFFKSDESAMKSIVCHLPDSKANTSAVKKLLTTFVPVAWMGEIPSNLKIFTRPSCIRKAFIPSNTV